ncbi:MAG: slipin family protein [Bacteroidia bacterium]
MKRIVINKWTKGIVLKNGTYVKTIHEGVYWLMYGQEIIVYDMAIPFKTPVNLSILLTDENFVSATTVVTVKDNEIALYYANDMFVSVVNTGRYVYWNGLINCKYVIINLANCTIDTSIGSALLTHKDVAPYIRTSVIEPYEKGILFIDGSFNKIMEAGTYNFWKNSTTINVVKVDIRTQLMDINAQEILTKDKAALRININMQYIVSDVVKALVNNSAYDKQLYVLAQLTIREFVSTVSFDELMEKRDALAKLVTESIATKATLLGVTISHIGIKDIVLPGDMKDIMNQVLIAEKKAQANIIMRREETASTRSLLNTAKLMEDNTMLFKLKEMEYVEKIADKIQSISISGGGQVVDQLKQLFVPTK